MIIPRSISVLLPNVTTLKAYLIEYHDGWSEQFKEANIERLVQGTLVSHDTTPSSTTTTTRYPPGERDSTSRMSQVTRKMIAYVGH